MGKMSVERIFRPRKKQPPPKNELERAISRAQSRLVSNLWFDTHCRVGSCTNNMYATHIFRPFRKEIEALAMGRLRGFNYKGVYMRHAEDVWLWERFKFLAEVKIEEGDTTGDWQGLIDAILTYHIKPSEVDDSAERD